MLQINKYFEKQILKKPAFKKTQVFFSMSKKWHVLDDNTSPISIDIIAVLDKKTTSRYQKLDNPPRVLIHLANHTLAVIFDTPSKTHKSTLDKYVVELDECLTAATSAFHANHDELTGILNRHGIKFELERIHAEIVNLSKKSNTDDQQILNNEKIILFSFDLDRFKSVNDTFGHQAGDIILASFAERLSKIVKNLESKYSAKFIFGRPGGEEFEVLCLGKISKQDQIALETDIQALMGKPSFPTKDEIDKQLRKNPDHNKDLNDAQLPQIVTSSIGVASAIIKSSTSELESTHSRLRIQADAALYRAKNDGRNCIRNYVEIRERHGRIIRHYKDSDVVQIDIGSKVGVERADVYAVYFPPFTGTEKVQEQNGTKILGNFPLVESAKIKIISVQPDVSFCVVLERINDEAFPSGSLLKRVHIGSTPILVDRTSDQLATVDCSSSLPTYVQRLIKHGNLDCVFRLDAVLKIEEVEKRNEKLNDLVMIVRIIFPATTRIFHGVGGGLYSVTCKNFDEKTISGQDAIKKLNSTIENKKINLYGGACIFDDIPDHLEKSAEAIIFYANSTLHAYRKEKGKIHLFTEAAPPAVVHKWRRSSDIESLIKDYHQFRSYGFDSAQFDNHLGLAIMENNATDYFAAAEISFHRAAEKEKEKPVFRGNLGIMLTKQGKFQEAYDTFLSIEKYVLQARSGYILSYAKSALEVAPTSTKKERQDISNILLLAINSYAISPVQHDYKSWWDEIKARLKTGYFD